MSTAMFSGGVVVVYDLPTLAKSINQEHRNVLASSRSMLEHAICAGRFLRQAKKELKELRAFNPTLPVFKEWVPEATGVSYPTAAKYMRAVTLWEEKGIPRDTFDLDTSLRQFLGIEDAKTPQPTPTDLSQDDASHALKLHALVERGATEAERDVARRKLEAFAKGFGRTAEALVSKAEDMLPDYEKTDKQVRVEKAEAEAQAAKAEAASLRSQLEAIQSRITQLRTDCTSMTREALEEAYIGLVLEREGFTEILKKKAA